TYLEHARQLSESLNDVAILRLVYSSMADALTPAAHFEQIMQWAWRCLALGEAHQDWKAMALAYVNLSYAVGHLGRWQAMDDFGQRGREFAQRAGWLNVDVWNAMQCAEAAYYQGELQTAVQLARESLALAT